VEPNLLEKLIAALFNEHGAQVIIAGRKPLEEGILIAKKIGVNVAYLKLDGQAPIH
jgi:hypothetical protein